MTMAMGSSCSVCPFKDKESCYKWNADLRVAKVQHNQEWILKEIGLLKEQLKQKDGKITNLRNEVKQKDIQLNAKIQKHNAQIQRTQNEMKQKDMDIEKRLLEHMSHQWQLKRIEMPLPNMTKLQLHTQTPTITESFPLPLPNRTRAIIIQLDIHQWVLGYYIGYLVGTIGQRGNANGATTFHQRHQINYPNAWTVEMLVPWQTDGQNVIELKVSDSFNNQANIWFTFKVSGYITA